ncbi:hypothetical protein [Crocinitomix algicola]|uniref:hypothetical protein n=1 Tax=Crocinitomix algicola TaxID=1740263 RepID=UPI00087206C3|nr:hypothetical protein [Crocinitomix algicola]
MLKNKLLFFVLGVFLFASCTKEGELNYRERKLVGTWYYETVRVSEGWSSQKITNDYHAVYLTFNADFSFDFRDEINEIYGSGLWEMTETYDGEYASDEIFISFNDDLTGDLYQIIFENISVTKRRVNAVYQDGSTRYNYTLYKV